MTLLTDKLPSFLLSLLWVTVIAFSVVHLSPGDAAKNFVSTDLHDETLLADPMQQQQQQEIWRKKLGLNLPLFYFSLESIADKVADGRSNQQIKPDNWKYWVPIVRLHPENQFHRWLFGDGTFSEGILHGDFGISYSTRQPVSELLKGRIGWSIGLSLCSLFIAFAISIPLGFRAALHPGSRFDRVLKGFSLMILSLPVFWLAIVLLLVFANPDGLNWLPASGTRPTDFVSSGWLSNFTATFPYLILPTVCYTIGTLAFLLRSVRDVAYDELQTDYVRTALAKGNDENTTLYTHVLRNMLPTLLTLFSLAFTAAISGAVLIESIFAIPGMGLTIEQAVYGKDYPVISAIFLIASIITLLGFLLTDLVITRLDPRTVKPSAAK